jgi:hypothetical protein
VPAGATKTIYCRLTNTELDNAFVSGFEKFSIPERKRLMNYYAAYFAPWNECRMALIQRQAIAGLLWTKQFYHFDVDVGLVPPMALHRRPSNRRVVTMIGST